MKKIGVRVLILMILIIPDFAQTKSNKLKNQFPLEVSFFNHSITMPFSGIILSPLHPGFSLGTEYCYKQGRLGRLFQNLHAGYYYNEYNARAIFLKTGAGYRYTAGFGLFGDLSLGLGYLHSFHPTEIFAQNAQGEYEKVKDHGKGSIIFLVAIGIGYDFSQKVGWPVSVFFRFQPYIQTPYSVESSVLPQSMLHFGIRVQLW